MAVHTRIATGSVIFYDNTAESGDEIINHTFTTTPFAPTTIVNILVSYA